MARELPDGLAGRPTSRPWGAFSLGIAVVAILAYGPSLGLSSSFGVLGVAFALLALRTRDRGRALAYLAFVLNLALCAIFVYIVAG